MPTDEDESILQNDYLRRRVRLPPPKAVGDVVSQLLARRGYAQVQSAAGCQDAWQQAVGEKLAPHTRAGSVRRGVLEVLVANSAALHEVAFVKAKIIKTLARLLPDQKIRDLRLRVGPLD
jgi:predicted nucleic acid-binding Zn ribbon protein